MPHQALERSATRAERRVPEQPGTIVCKSLHAAFREAGCLKSLKTLVERRPLAVGRRCQGTDKGALGRGYVEAGPYHTYI